LNAEMKRDVSAGPRNERNDEEGPSTSVLHSRPVRKGAIPESAMQVGDISMGRWWEITILGGGVQRACAESQPFWKENRKSVDGREKGRFS